MKAPVFAAVLSVVLCLGCAKRRDPSAVVWQNALDADAVVLADVRSDGVRDRFFVREVLVARKAGEGFFKIGREIPGISHGDSFAHSNTAVMSFRKPERLWGCFNISAVRDGEILVMHGPRRDYGTFAAELRKKG